jgi:hypothetical protein
MGIDGPLGVIATIIGFALLIWMIQGLNKEVSLVKVFTPPRSGTLSDWIGWLFVAGFLVLFFFSAVSTILTGENGCGPDEQVNCWGDCV